MIRHIAFMMLLGFAVIGATTLLTGCGASGHRIGSFGTSG